MLRRLEMQNFRKCVNEVMNFTHGLNVVRGANESSKTTRVEAIQYALYGSSTLRTPLDQAVTWGQKPSTLNVELDIEVQGKPYTFVRSSSGAEVRVNGKPFVTGQKEVSAFAATILGADGKTVQRLLMSNQNAIRGALDEGPKAVATQIENLCDFDVFDTVIERMQEKLILGSPAILESRLHDAEDKLACFVEPVKPDLDGVKAEIAASEEKMLALEADIVKADKATATAYSLWQNAENAQRMHTTVTTNLRKQEEDLRLHTAQLEAAEAKVKKAPDQALIDAYKVQLADATTHARKMEAWEKYEKLEYPTVFWGGDKESLYAEIKRDEENLEADEGKVRGYEASISEYKSQIGAMRAKIITTLTCPTCKQEVKNKEEILAQNVALEAELAALEKAIDKSAGFKIQYLAICGALRDSINTKRALLKSATPFEQFAATYGEFIVTDMAFVPLKLAWKGELPSSEAPDQTQIKERLASLETLQDEARRAAGQAEALREAIANDLVAIENAKQQVLQYPLVADVNALMRAHMSCQGLATSKKTAKEDLHTLAQGLSHRLVTDQAQYDQAMQRGKDIKDEVAQCKEDLEALGFNNALLKKIRAIRPLVADRLWNQVLSAVSTLFSSIRGESSIITKNKDGFRCNGQSVESLSGSTLDALGNALRVCLIKTFIPHVNFMVIDEPFASFDVERTTSALGALKRSNIAQILLVTHEEVSAAVADNVIEL